MKRALGALCVGVSAASGTGCSIVVDIPAECVESIDCPQVGADCREGLCTRVREFVQVTDPLRGNQRWTSERDYLLEETVFLESGVLTIEAGTRVFGARPQAALVVVPGAALVVNGTADAPVVFTSIRPPGSRSPGDWGGIALLGDDFINAPGGVDDLEGLPPEARTRYGGSASDPSRGCGTLQYLRIEFAGFRLFANQELNGLTLAGCGPETLVDFVQVHRGADDGIELFGGRAKIRHAVVTQPADDGLDWDQGWRGLAQFVIVQQRNSDKNGIEADNSETDASALPRSSPRVYNLTVVADNAPQTRSVGATLRRGTAGEIVNAVFVGHRGGSVQIVDRETQACALATDGEGPGCSQASGSFTGLDVRASVFVDGGADGDSHFPTEFDFDPENENTLEGFVLEEWIERAERRTETLPRGEAVLVDPLGRTSPNFAPRAGGPLAELSDLAESPPLDEEFDSTARFLGAIRSEAEDWTRGWTAFPVD
mgnify:CR=1 FL=1